MAEIPVAVREALDLAFSMTADAEKPINAGGIDPDLWQGLALDAVAVALAAAKEEGRREEREACAKIAEEFSPFVIRQLEQARPAASVVHEQHRAQGGTRTVADLIRARSVKP